MHLIGKGQRRFTAALAATLLLSFAGCKSNTAHHSGTDEHPAVAYTQIDPATAGVVEGSIHLAGKAPARIEIDMAQDPACAMSTQGANYSEGIVANGGKLQNVFLYVKDGLGDKKYAPSNTPVVLDQQGCRYVPHVLGAAVGQPVEFRNSDPTMHNVHMEPTVGGNKPFDISQPPNGGTTRHAFAGAELMIPVRCNNHPWMQAFLNITPNPFFAVSDASGNFTIHGLPPGTYTLVADQEQLGQQQMTVTVAPQKTAKADFTYGSK